MAQHISITQLLRKNYSCAEKKELALNWVDAWQLDQSKCITRLGIAVKNNDFDEQCIAVGQLKELSLKRFSALPNVIDAAFEAENIARKFKAKRDEYLKSNDK
ncbi:MAG: hypothetical protein COB33_011480 [Thiotrichaceae bacterium]|nr:hypothetical protein [Thiotrichaceae bacterium]PCI14298.1 MAG: hypothetical protein COB71_02935 [Thiotrichales bacterium]